MSEHMPVHEDRYYFYADSTLDYDSSIHSHKYQARIKPGVYTDQV
jgi:hypothetical protein